MTGLSMGTAMAIADKFPWDRYKTFVDVGTARGGLPGQLALAHDHLSGGGFDYTGGECASWMREAGFRETYVEHLVGPDSIVVGIK